MHQFLTPLRYPGGKGRLTQCVADLMAANDLVGGHYLEPFAGGAGVALSLLALEYASHVHINDLNRSVHAFWQSVLREPEELCSLISRTRVSMAQRRRQCAVQTDPDASPLELGFSTFFLNRVNRSGIILGGVIGGHDQAGDWKLDARYNKPVSQRPIELALVPAYRFSDPYSLDFIFHLVRLRLRMLRR